MRCCRCLHAPQVLLAHDHAVSPSRQANNYAIPAVNVTSSSIINAVLESAKVGFAHAA